MRIPLLVILADLALFAFGFYVAQDLEWRAAFAASPHGACFPLCNYSPSLGRSLLTQFFTMDGNGAHLVSPLTLDWLQLLGLALVVVNAWFAYSFLARRRKARAYAESGPGPKP